MFSKSSIRFVLMFKYFFQLSLLTSLCFLANSSLSFLSSSFLQEAFNTKLPSFSSTLSSCTSCLNVQNSIPCYLRAPSGLLPSKAAISSNFCLLEAFFSSSTASSSLQESLNSASAFLIFSFVEINFRSLLSSSLSSGLVVACTQMGQNHVI